MSIIHFRVVCQRGFGGEVVQAATVIHTGQCPESVTIPLSPLAVPRGDAGRFEMALTLLRTRRRRHGGWTLGVIRRTKTGVPCYLTVCVSAAEVLPASVALPA